MPKFKLKIHQYRSTRSTWCGREIDGITGSPSNKDGTVPRVRCTRDVADVTCRTCLKADAAEQRRQR